MPAGFGHAQALSAAAGSPSATLKTDRYLPQMRALRASPRIPAFHSAKLWRYLAHEKGQVIDIPKESAIGFRRQNPILPPRTAITSRLTDFRLLPDICSLLYRKKPGVGKKVKGPGCPMIFSDWGIPSPKNPLAHFWKSGVKTFART